MATESYQPESGSVPATGASPESPRKARSTASASVDISAGITSSEDGLELVSITLSANGVATTRLLSPHLALALADSLVGFAQLILGDDYEDGESGDVDVDWDDFGDLTPDEHNPPFTDTDFASVINRAAKKKL